MKTNLNPKTPPSPPLVRGGIDAFSPLYKGGLRGVFVAIVLLVLALPSHTAQAATYAHCAGFGGNTCSAENCGPLMCGIATKCAQLGDCSIGDIMVVVYNAGNFILALIASLVFLMYILGGFYFLIARGDSHMVEKGKNYLKYSTFGLIIVFLAYALIETLETVLKSGTFPQ